MNTPQSIRDLMKKIDSKDLTKPREIGREAVKATLSPEQWDQNFKFSQDLQKNTIDRHKLCRHPLIGLLNTEKLNPEATKLIHMEFSYAFAEIFTDSLVQAMVTSSQLEKQLGPMGKVSARFLLQLNLLDELGFQPGGESKDDYHGNPFLAHYIQFHETLEQLNVRHENFLDFQPSKAAQKARKTFTDQYSSHLKLTSVLAAAETVFTLFAGPWAKSVGLSTEIDVSRGYHKIHVEDDHGEFVDDDHSEDSWYLFRQAVQEKDYSQVQEDIQYWLDQWYDFGDQVMHIAHQATQKKQNFKENLI